MSKVLLKNLLDGTFNLDLFIKWLKNEKVEEMYLFEYECSQAEFVLFFLNYLHEETTGILHSFSNQVTPNKIRTPRRLDTFSSVSKIQDSRKSCRRAALFQDNSDNQNDQFLGVYTLAIENQITSTPRLNTSHQSFDQSHSFDSVCPISPIYKPRNSLTKSITPRSNSSFCLGDFIVQKRSSCKKKQKQYNNDSVIQNSDKPNIENCLNQSNVELNKELSQKHSSNGNTSFRSSKRRINPTNLSQDGGILNTKRILSNENSFSFQKVSETEMSGENIREQRDLLREERLKIISRAKFVERENTVTSKPVCTQSVEKPCPESVTFKFQLDILSQIYSVLFDLNLVLNILSELYFLISLILLQVNNFNDKKIEELRTSLQNSLTNIIDHDSENFENIFKSVHNCVYFAASVLNKQCYLLSALDRTSLKLLEENVRLKTFVPDLSAQLVVYYGKKTEKKCELYTQNCNETVSFISDTDNRENFLTDSSFHAFKKQRDLFYELLRIWETNHLQPGWNFSAVLSSKILNLIFMHSDPVNSMHLARLFKNQLLADTTQHVDNAPLPTCLNGLTNIDTGKLNRLRNRLTSKNTTGGPNPELIFPGRQEFYKEFIIASCSPVFHRHLIDCFVAHILQIDDDFIITYTEEDPVAEADQETKTLYINCIKSLKILAKYLGLVDSLPYKTDFSSNHQILTSQITVRKNFIPSIDVVKRVNSALQNSQLILTIPWVADYLAMMDHVTLRLPYFSDLIEMLFDIHYYCTKSFTSLKLEKVLILKLCLGWLFERPNFPLDSYQRWISKKYEQNSTESILTKYNSTNISQNSNITYVDTLDIVDEFILFTCCPYLYEIRNVLTSDLSNSKFNKSGSTKYIRPISAVANNNDICNKRVQKQLEDAFFHNQPSSTKKTIDLVSERVASACVKHICNSLVPNAKLKFLEIFQQHLEHVLLLRDPVERSEKITLCCVEHAKNLSDNSFKEFETSANNEIEYYIKERCKNSLIALLADDQHIITLSTCVSITIDKSIERVQQWFSLHVNPGIFLKEFVLEMENIKQSVSQNGKKITYKLPSRGKNIEHDPNVKSPVKLLTYIREMMYQIHDKSNDITLDSLKQLLEDSILTCQKRCDLNPVAQLTICRMFFDMFFILATNLPELAVDESFLDILLLFWEKYVHKNEKENFFNRILCSRNAYMFEQSQKPEITWQACELLIIKLMNKKLLKSEQFEQQTIAMFRYEWQRNTMKYFIICVQNIIDNYVKKYENQNNFTYILNWIADYCNDEEFF